MLMLLMNQMQKMPGSLVDYWRLPHFSHYGN
jgi:hypothetical protein